jgi:hypothetical protein
MLRLLPKATNAQIAAAGSSSGPLLPLLQLSGRTLLVLARGLTLRGDIKVHMLAPALFACLEHLIWLGTELQQLALPGDPRKAAKALQDLQLQQQQLQQALTTAVWRLKEAAPRPVSAERAQQLQQEQQQNPVVPPGYRRRQMHVQQSTAELAELANRHPADTVTIESFNPTQLEYVSFELPAAVAASLIGPQLQQQLQQFGAALWSALPQLRCCNNWQCVSIAGVSEAKLAGKASRCGKCKVPK